MTTLKYTRNGIKVELMINAKPRSIHVSGQAYPFLSNFHAIRFDCKTSIRKGKQLHPNFDISLNGTHSETDLTRYMKALHIVQDEVAELKGRMLELYNPDNAATLIEKSLSDNINESLLLVNLCSTLHGELLPTHSVNFRKGKDSSPTVLDHILRSDAFKKVLIDGNLILGNWKGLESDKMLEDDLVPNSKATFELIVAIIDKTKFKYSGDDELFVDNINNNYEFLELALRQMELSISNKIPFANTFS